MIILRLTAESWPASAVDDGRGAEFVGTARDHSQGFRLTIPGHEWRALGEPDELYFAAAARPLTARELLP